MVEPVRNIFSRAIGFLPSLVGALVILFIGWIVAKIIQKVLTKIFQLIKFDAISDKSGLSNLFKRAGIKYSLSQLLGILSYWFVMLLVFISALNALNLTITAQLLDKIIYYIPNVMASLFIFVVGMYFATFLAGLVRTATSGVGMRESLFLGRLVQTIVVIFAFAIALEQLRIKAAILSFAFNIILASLGLAIGIAFGLGGRDIASKLLEDWRDRLRKKEEITQ
jgi:hypothetical protein